MTGRPERDALGEPLSDPGDLPATARAAVMTGPGRIEIREFRVVPPEDGWALLRISFSGICGTDLHTWSGEVLQYAGTPHERGISYPLIPGHENVGVVAAVGGAVRDAHGRRVGVGDRVVPGANVTCGECFYCRGGFPYYACERLEDYGNSLGATSPPHLFGGWSEYLYLMPGSRLFLVPDAVPSRMAALTELFSVTHGLDRVEGGLAGATVYVVGCGPLGACHVVKARHLGAERVLVADRAPRRIEAARALGVTEAFDVGRTTREERLEAVREATGGRGADVAVDAAGAPEAFLEGLESLRFAGTLVEVGAFTGSRPTEVDVAKICAKDVRILGVGGEDDAAYPETLRVMAERGDELGLESLVTHVLPLERAAEGLALAQRGEAMKVLLTPERPGAR